MMKPNTTTNPLLRHAPPHPPGRVHAHPRKTEPRHLGHHIVCVMRPTDARRPDRCVCPATSVPKELGVGYNLPARRLYPTCSLDRPARPSPPGATISCAGGPVRRPSAQRGRRAVVARADGGRAPLGVVAVPAPRQVHPLHLRQQCRQL
eukprot:2059815-Prymnesium_polylepis.1